MLSFLELIWAHLCILIIKEKILKDILREGKKRRLDGTTCTAEAKYPINFTQSEKRFVLRPHHNGNKIFCLLMLQKYINSKQKSQK